MSTLAKWVVKRPWLSRAVVLAIAILSGWTLVLVENPSRTVVPFGSFRAEAVIGLLVLLLGILLLRLLHGQHVQVTTTDTLNDYARLQQLNAERKAALAAASLRLQQSDNIESLCQNALTELHALVGLLQGVIYVIDNTGAEHLRLSGQFACFSPPPERCQLGEGLLGQCARERRTMVITAPDDTTGWRIHSGLGSSRPAALLIMPILLKDTLLGVLEAALLAPPDETSQETLDEIGEMLALNIEILRRSERTEALLQSSVRAERASAEHAYFQQVLIDTIPYPVFYKGPDARFLGFNRAYEDTFAVKREDLIGKRVIDLDYLPEADRIAYQAEDEAVIASAGKVQREMKIPFADGKLHDTLYYVSGFRNADGAPGGLVGTFIDLSEARRPS